MGETAFEKHYYINQNVLLRRFWWLPVSLIIFMILLPFMDIGVSLTDVFGMSFVLSFHCGAGLRHFVAPDAADRHAGRRAPANAGDVGYNHMGQYRLDRLQGHVD